MRYIPRKSKVKTEVFHNFTIADLVMAIIGIGIGVGEDRAIEAAREAIQSPLLETSIRGAKGVLLNITGGANLGLLEINEASTLVQESCDPEANIIFGASIREDLAEVLSGLSPRERDVLRLRFGMDDGRQRTLEEVGQLFGVTRERIRQIEAKALRKLRHPNRSKRLKEYVEV